ncbi:hypothetical protein Tco_1133638 [Tanacetum coccineum]
MSNRLASNMDEGIDEQELKHITAIMQRTRRFLMQGSATVARSIGNSNVTPDSPDMCDNDIQDETTIIVECDDDRVVYLLI